MVCKADNWKKEREKHYIQHVQLCLQSTSEVKHILDWKKNTCIYRIHLCTKNSYVIFAVNFTGNQYVSIFDPRYTLTARGYTITIAYFTKCWPIVCTLNLQPEKFLSVLRRITLQTSCKHYFLTLESEDNFIIKKITLTIQNQHVTINN